MAAPVPAITPGTPAGVKMKDGYQTLIHILAAPTASLFEVTLPPPPMQGGESINTTTMRNAVWETMWPGQLISMAPITGSAGYDPAVYTALVAALNTVTTITMFLPNGGALAWYGALTDFTPDALASRTFPTASITLMATNEDPVNNVEEGPVYVAPLGVMAAMEKAGINPPSFMQRAFKIASRQSEMQKANQVKLGGMVEALKKEGAVK